MNAKWLDREIMRLRIAEKNAETTSRKKSLREEINKLEQEKMRRERGYLVG